MLLIALVLGAVARAAEVVWLAPPDDPAVISVVAAQAGATGPPLEVAQLRSAATRWTDADDRRLAAVADTLRGVRVYETRLDGELVIMADLEPAIEAVQVLRDPADRDVLFGALAYQGFAVDRFFADALGDDEKAAPYRATVQERPLPRPWLDAVALAPMRMVTPYEINEAPQRVRYGELAALVNGGLPARIGVAGVPVGARLVVDGAEAAHAPAPDVPAVVSLPPGRHFVHVERDGVIVHREVLRLEEGERVDLEIDLQDAAWDAFFDGVFSGAPRPDGLAAALDAVGGSVWVVSPESRGRLRAIEITADGAAPVDVATTVPGTPAPTVVENGLSVVIGVGAGWLSSGDFYLQDPIAVPRTVAAVNALAPAFSGGLELDAGLMRAGVGADVLVPFGTYHVAYSGERQVRARVYPHAAVGLRWVQLTGGYVFPHHGVVGARATLPLSRAVDLRAVGTLGPAPRTARGDGTVWRGKPLYSAWLGAAWRIGL